MAQDSAAAMVAGRRERVYRAFETVEDMSYAAQRDVKRLVVIVAANFTGFHGVLRDVIQEGKGVKGLRSRDADSDLHRVGNQRLLGPCVSYLLRLGSKTKGPSCAFRCFI